MARIFIALDIPDDIKAMLGRLIKKWPAGPHSTIRWVNPLQLHITLAFLGDITEELLERVCNAAQGIACATQPFNLAIQGTGVFPGPKNPRVLWCGCMGDLHAIENLQKNIQTMLEGMGLPIEKRPFTPHITLGRIRSVTAPAVITEFLRSPCKSEPFGVREITIYKSRLLAKGPEYERYRQYPFTAQAQIPRLEGTSKNCLIVR